MPERLSGGEKLKEFLKLNAPQGVREAKLFRDRISV